MKATEARKLAEKSAKTVVIDPYLEKIYALIKKAAEKGERSIRYEPYLLRGEPFSFSTAVDDAFHKRLIKDGYTFKSFQGCDDGPNRSSPAYETINW